jgi:hypothetical protein
VLSLVTSGLAGDPQRCKPVSNSPFELQTAYPLAAAALGNILIHRPLLCSWLCRDDQPLCERFTGSIEGSGVVSGPLPGNTWPIMLTASLKQGKALLAALNARKVTSVTLTSPPNPSVDVPIMLKFTGGSTDFFAAAAGTGALGALWSAHAGCSAKQIVDAVRATARVKVDSSLSPEELKAQYGSGLPQVGDL